MADVALPVLLNQGWNTMTPSLLAKEGSLIDVHNYEMTNGVGYRRIDGYERYDGYPNGALYKFFEVQIVADDPGEQSLLQAGTVIARVVEATNGEMPVEGSGYDSVGVILDSNGGNSYYFSPYNEAGLPYSGEQLKVLALEDVVVDVTVTTTPVDARTIITDPDAYMEAVRDYSRVLRLNVQDLPSAVAGIWWFKNNAYAAIDAYELTYVNSPAFGPYPAPGTLLQHRGAIWQVLGYGSLVPGGSPVPGEVRIILEYIQPTTTFNDNITEIDDSGSLGTIYGTKSTTATVGSTYARIVKLNTPDTSTSRGVTSLRPAIRVPFDAGSYSSEILPLDSDYTITDTVAGKTVAATLLHVEVDTGTFGAANATGWMTFGLDSFTGGSSIQDNWDIMYGPSLLAKVNTAAGNIEGLVIPGTGTLNETNTRYVTITNNFYGGTDRRTAYGTTGASRAFWADETYCGSIFTQDDELLDQPKYIAYHGGRLALGFAQGSVVRSVAGEPLSYSGVSGADEIATGDKITGLIEMPGDTLVVLGQNSVRTITGYSDADTQVRTIAAGAGAFDYTGVLAGNDVLYCGVNGISTLKQTAAYGDFVGSRVSDPIYDWLQPRLLTDNAGFETGGVAMAYPVKSKNQYRLVLKTGDTITVTMAGDTYLLTKSNRGHSGDVRVPFAWTSRVSDRGKEMILVVWDRELAIEGVDGQVGTLPENDRVYQLDTGWGFDGDTFEHWMDLAYFFVQNGTQYTTLTKMRLHGQSYGHATLDVKASGIEDDYDQGWSSRIQDISLPATPVLLRNSLDNFTTFIDHANWGLGVKLRINGTQEAGLTSTEPSHVCQVLVLYLQPEGGLDG